MLKCGSGNVSNNSTVSTPPPPPFDISCHPQKNWISPLLTTPYGHMCEMSFIPSPYSVWWSCMELLGFREFWFDSLTLGKFRDCYWYSCDKLRELDNFDKYLLNFTHFYTTHFQVVRNVWKSYNTKLYCNVHNLLTTRPLDIIMWYV